MLRGGERIGGWIVDAPLGEGGMGAVYRVHSALSGRVAAALKVMKPSGEPDARARFIREAEALSALSHPAVVRVMGFNEDASRGLLYLVMELAVGETLRERLHRGAMDLPEALRTFAPLASALDHAHAAGIFHRDLKPANVVLCADGPRLVDFGIAAAAHVEGTDHEPHYGTLAYLPPEVFRGEHPHPAALDVYALGLLLYEALTGTRAFSLRPGTPPAAAAETIAAHKAQQGPLDPGAPVPERLRDAIRRATDPDPARRPAMHDVRRAIESLIERRGSTAAADATPTPSARLPMVLPPAERTVRVPDPPRRSVIPRRPLRDLMLVILALLAAAALGGGLAWRLHPAPAPAPTVSPLPADGNARAARPRPSLSPWTMSPLAPAVSPVPGVTPRPSPRPSAPSPVPTPTPEETAAGDTQEDRDAATAPVDVSGDWSVTNRIEATTYAPYAGLRLGYRLRLHQVGDEITGEGEKATENGVALPPERRTPITVRGRVAGGSVVLEFAEEGAMRTTTGELRWSLSPEGDRLRGRFSSDAGSSRGSSQAQRDR